MTRIWNWIKSHLFDGFLITFVYEMIEEVIENVLAYFIADCIIEFTFKAVTTVAITQGLKTMGKKVLFPYIKKITYREGNDKMSKIKQFLGKIKEFGTWVFCNKKTLLGTASASVLALTGTGVIDITGLAPLYISGVNITPYVFYGLLVVFTLFGIYGKGIEGIKTFFERVGLIKDAKEKKALTKEAKKEIKAEEKLANQTQAQQEKKLAKEEAEKKAKAEKEKAEAEHKAKVAEIKKQLLADTKKAE